MTKEEAIKILKFQRGYFCDFKGCQEQQAFTMAIKALEQQPCEDCISRAAVLDKKELVELEDGQSFYCINPKDVETLPSVTPQPKMGEWLTNPLADYAGEGYFICSKCKNDVYDVSDYCPNCGAKMEVEE